MTPQEEQEHYLYLKLKQKQMAGAVQAPQAQPDMSGSFPEVRNIATSDTSIPQKLWAGLQVPGQMAQRGLSQMSEELKPQPEITGNLVRDVAANYPSVSADILSKVAPAFVSRASIVGGAAGKALGSVAPLIKSLARGAGAQAESLTGAAKGSLEAAYEDPSLMFTGSKAAAKPLYAAAKEANPVSVFKGMYKPEQIIDTAKETLANGGTLNPSDALVYRKAVDVLSRSGRYVKDALFDMRGEADTLAKQSEDIAAADPLHQRGVYAESLRNLLPQNKYGGTSAFKAGIITALHNMGGVGKMVGTLMSPAAAGLAASATGAAAKAGALNPANLPVAAGLNVLGKDPQIKQALLQILQKIMVSKAQPVGQVVQ